VGNEGRLGAQSILAKPVSAACNLACDYCFYRPHQVPYRRPGRMSEETLAALLRQYMPLVEAAPICWQGGEPLLAGVEFYRKVVELEARYGRAGQAVSNAVQTNGLLLNVEFARLFNEYSFVVGISLDGPRELHEMHRGKGTHAKVLEGVRLLHRAGVATNALCAVTRDSQGRGREAYHFLLEQGFDHVQFIPIVEFGPEGEALPFAVEAEGFGDFLCEVFEAWLEEGVGRVVVRDFENVLGLCLGFEAAECTFRETCGDYVVVEYNGDVYPCDFYVREEWRLGNLAAEALSGMGGGRLQEFAARKRELGQRCAECEWVALCNGGCPRRRREGVDYLCAGYRRFFEHSMKEFRRLAATIEAGA
jgi:uncharacterized protein